jgi:hypothetical protein
LLFRLAANGSHACAVFVGLFCPQSDFGFPAGAVSWRCLATQFGDAIVSDFFPKFGLWREAQRRREDAASVFASSMAMGLTD